MSIHQSSGPYGSPPISPILRPRNNFYEALSFSRDELLFIYDLINLPLDSLTDEGSGEAACKALGQRIFDTFKLKGQGKSELGEAALYKIHCAIPKFCSDGRVRSLQIRYAWAGIGDQNYRWGEEWKQFP
ncbi:MAG: hypothetical protein JSS62_05350 [Verrucomicrobia bacterium]|nr:hypothetical protein [Verrucomicrobiota bacterium]MBS0647271.1 hypothetical protein [Verrucomicrobiota bacterium]